jgi:glycosyltransferase involved in cell wall biosynthesis
MARLPAFQRGGHRQMKVTILTDRVLRYAAPQVGYLAQVLHEHGHEVTLWSLRDEARSATASPSPPYRCRYLSRGATSGKLGNVRVAAGMLAAACGRTDVLIAVDAMGFLPALCTRLVRPRIRLVAYLLELHTVRECPLSLCTRALTLWGRRADMVVEVEPHRARLRRRQLGLAYTPLVVRNSSIADGDVCADGGGLAGCPPDGCFRVLYHGHVDKGTGVLEALDAMEHVRASAHLYVAGIGDPGLIERIAHSRHATYLGAVERSDLLGCVASADAGVVMWRGASLNVKYCAPNKLMEFMRCGVPVLCSPNPSLRFVEAEGWGRCVDPSSPVEIAHVIDEWAADPALCARMGQVAQELFRSTYDYRHQSQALVARLEGWQVA